MKLVNSFGIGSARYCSCLPFLPSSSSSSSASSSSSKLQGVLLGDGATQRAGEAVIDIPIGCGIARWHVDRRQRLRFFKAHDDVVSCMLRSPVLSFLSSSSSSSPASSLQVIVTASDGGELSLWQEEGAAREEAWRRLCTAHHEPVAMRTVKVTHVAFSPSGRLLLTTSEHGPGGLLTLFSLLQEAEAEAEAETSSSSSAEEVAREERLRLALRKEREVAAGLALSFAEWVDGDEEEDVVFAVQQQRGSVEAAAAATDSSSMTAAAGEEQTPKKGVALVLLSLSSSASSDASSSSPFLLRRELEGERTVSVAVKVPPPHSNGGAKQKQQEAPRIVIARGRIVSVIDMRSLSTLWQTDSLGSGLLKCLALVASSFKKAEEEEEEAAERMMRTEKEEDEEHHHHLLLPSDNGRLFFWRHKQQQPRQGESAGSIVAASPEEVHLVGVPPGNVYFSSFDPASSTLWLITDSSILSCQLPLSSSSSASSSSASSLETKKLMVKVESQLSFHEMTCCGIDWNREGDKVAAGDFGGNVLVWDVDHFGPVRRTNVGGMPVRSICWGNGRLLRSSSSGEAEEAAEKEEEGLSDGKRVMIGCYGGAIYSWDPVLVSSSSEKEEIAEMEGDKEAKLWAQLSDTVTCLKWQPTGSLLAAATTDGRLYLLQQNEEENADVVKVIEAHPPDREGPQNLQFGSLNLFAEVWSLTWSPCGRFLATSSEDQTTRIWDLQRLLCLKEKKGCEVAVEPERVLRGHTAAVTSVDWQVTQLGELIATCADDKSIRVWNAKTWQLHHVFDTGEHNTEWHTVTYLALERGGHRLACSTQNGYLFVWCLITGQQLFGAKTHTASVEGLSWSHASGLLASCASDCTINVFSCL
ncbi:Cytosolic iron-sulfur protein assembly protein CIAO1 [Balamuthia mandrillaris]